MKALIKTTLLASTVVAALTACTPQERQSENKTQRIKIQSQMDASELADAGEQLISPYTFMLADTVFTEALKKDPNNKKAQLYKALLKPHMALKGIYNRIKPITRTHGDIAKLEKNIKDTPESPMKNFLLAGKEDISKIEQIQEVLSQYADGYLELRNFLKKNQDLSLTLNLNPYVFEKEVIRNSTKSCRVVYGDENALNNSELASDQAIEPESTSYSIYDADGNLSAEIECDYQQVATININSADIVPLSQMAAGMYLYFKLPNAYSLKGLENLFTAGSEEKSAQEVFQTIMNTSGAATLRKNHGMDQLYKLGSDFVPAWKWAIQYQQQLCPQGPGVEEQRKGFLFSGGICISDINESQATLAQLEKALRGAIQLEAETASGETTTVAMDYFAWSKKPVQDLRSLGFTGFNECGKIVGLKDKTVGGLYPNGDVEKFMDTSCE